MPTTTTSSKSILVVDDEADIGDVLREVLIDQGYVVIRAANGAEGLRALAQNPDLVLVDTIMPVMSGPQMIRAMQGNPAQADIPVILMTAGPVRGKAVTKTVIRKPFPIEHLLDEIARLIGAP